MLRFIMSAFVAMLLVAPALTFAAADDDRVMGLYEGSFTGDAGEAETIYAKVAGLSETTWKAVFYVAGADGKETRTEVEGKAEAPRKPVVFDGTLSIPVLGGEVAVKGTIAKKKFDGTLTAAGKPEIGFSLKRVTKEPPSLGAAPPAGAIVLFDGTNTAAWRRDPEGWCIQPDGSMEVCGSNLRTIEEHGSGLYHIEFMTPYIPNEREQGRGNSGVYLLGRYEVQVLDNFGWEPKWDFCGGIYKVAVPLKDATLPPLMWQTYDITFTAAQFDASGAKTANARITVVHNGETVHDNLELPHPTPGGVSGDDGAKGPLLLQDHHNEVRFKNIWFQPAG